MHPDLNVYTWAEPKPMPTDLSDTLVVGISATALFDLTEADRVFRHEFKKDRETAIKRYRTYMLKREDAPLKDGTGMPLVRALLGLNKFVKPGQKNPLVEVVVMSRNSPETGGAGFQQHKGARPADFALCLFGRRVRC